MHELDFWKQYEGFSSSIGICIIQAINIMQNSTKRQQSNKYPKHTPYKCAEKTNRFHNSSRVWISCSSKSTSIHSMAGSITVTTCSCKYNSVHDYHAFRIFTKIPKTKTKYVPMFSMANEVRNHATSIHPYIKHKSCKLLTKFIKFKKQQGICSKATNQPKSWEEKLDRAWVWAAVSLRFWQCSSKHLTSIQHSHMDFPNMFLKFSNTAANNQHHAS